MLKWINNSLNKSHNTEISSDIKFQFLNIPGKILDLQFQCQSQSANKQLITQLTTQYTQALQYYEDKGDPRYLLYQKRMQRFLKKQNIDDILRGKSGHLVSKKDTTVKLFTQARAKSKSEVTRLIEQSEKIKNTINQKMKSSLKQQQSSLQNRINRRKTLSNRSTKTQEDQNNEQKIECNNKINSNLVLEKLDDKRWQKTKKVFI